MTLWILSFICTPDQQLSQKNKEKTVEDCYCEFIFPLGCQRSRVICNFSLEDLFLLSTTRFWEFLLCLIVLFSCALQLWNIENVFRQKILSMYLRTLMSHILLFWPHVTAKISPGSFVPSTTYCLGLVHFLTSDLCSKLTNALIISYRYIYIFQ